MFLHLFKTGKINVSNENLIKNIIRDDYILLENPVLKDFIKKNITDLFKIACENSFLKTVKHLVKLQETLDCKHYALDIHTQDETPFVSACANGDLMMVRYLVELSFSINSPINMHINHELPLKAACHSGNLALVKYFATLNTRFDLHVDNDYLFKYCHKYGYSEIEKCLTELLELYKSPPDIYDGKKLSLEEVRHLMESVFLQDYQNSHSAKIY